MKFTYLRLSDGVKLLFNLPFVVLVACIFFSMINYDHTKNVDYVNYQANYENGWEQFELGFEALIALSKSLGFEFSSFWSLVIFLEVVLIVLLYGNLLTLLVAAPNIFYLSQGLLGTQVRFALATLIFLNILKRLSRKKSIYLILPQSIFLHLSMLVGVYLALFAKKIKFFGGGASPSLMLIKILFFLSTLILMNMTIEIALNSLGYSYYVGSKYLEEKSISSTLYIYLSTTLCGFLLYCKVGLERYGWALSFSFLVLLFCIVFLGVAIVSGRYLGVYFLLEPFILCAYLERFGRRKSFFPLLILVVLFYLSKLIAY